MPLSKAKMRERKRQERSVKPKSNLKPEVSQPTPIEREPIKVKLIPFYNSEIHKAGDVVRQWVGGQLVMLTLPELDAEGKPLEVGSHGRLIVNPNLKRPPFRPMPKKVRGKK